MRTRPLVVTAESVRHPFRRRLPLHVLKVTDDELDKAPDDSDWKLFVLSFCAFFTAFYSFIF